MSYLSARALAGLKAYKYKSAGTTWLDDAHVPMWDYIVARLPATLAPNTITLFGTLWLVAAYLVNAYYLPDFTGPAPRWIFVLSAVSVVVYINLDCIDGKQARRTGSSSPLGQLFDHGCDALSVHLLLANLCCSLGLPCGVLSTVGVLGVKLPWLLAQWEEYHTGVMLYGNPYFGVMEGNYSIAAVHLLTAALGPRFWHWPLVTTGPTGTLSLRDAAILVLTAVGGTLQVSGQLARVFGRAAPPLPASERGAKQRGAGAAAWHLAQLCLVLALGGAWLADGRVAPGQCWLAVRA